MAIGTWTDDSHFELDGTRFLVRAVPLFETTDELLVVKPPGLVRRYLDLIERERPSSIVELGVKEGGSTALMALAAQPDRLLAGELSPEMPPGLARFIADRDLGDTIVTRFGLDQGDRAGLADFVDTNRTGPGIDLVVDDASHMLTPTRTSFEVLFPRVRAGGTYIIEDWAHECAIAAHMYEVLGDPALVAERLPAVIHVLHILNSPSHELPPEVIASMTAVGAPAGGSDETGDGDGRRLFSGLVRAAAGADLSALSGATLPRSRPLADLALQLSMIAATRPDLVAAVTIDQDWIEVRRGNGRILADGFRLDDVWADVFGYLPAPPAPRSAPLPR